MKYSLDIKLISNTAGVLTEVSNNLLSFGHVDLSDRADLYHGVVISDNEDGNRELNTTLRFDTKSARDSHSVTLRGLSGVFTQCETGSYIRHHVCYNDETPHKPCTEEIRYS